MEGGRASGVCCAGERPTAQSRHCGRIGGGIGDYDYDYDCDYDCDCGVDDVDDVDVDVDNRRGRV